MAGACDDVCAVAVLGDDPVATAAAALGIARSQSLRRRVVVVDLLGEHSDLSALLRDPEAPGITDMLEFGVSLGRAAHPVPSSTNLFIVPPGAESPLHSVFLSHPRWGVLVEDFRDAGALLLLVVPALVPGAEALLERLDGLVIVRGASIPTVRIPVIADVRLSAQYPPALRRTPALARARIEVEPRRSRLPFVALGIVALLIVSGGVWYMRPWWSGGAVHPAARVPAVDTVAPPVVAVAPAAPPPTAAWSVEISTLNSAEGAMLRVDQAVDSLPAATYSPTLPAPGGARWYRFMVGACVDSMAAEALLVSLRARGTAAKGRERVVRTPLALLVADSVAEADVQRQVTELRTQGLPAYALHVAPGQARVYVGVFEEELAAGPLAAHLDSLKLRSTLVPRVGSVH